MASAHLFFLTSLCLSFTVQLALSAESLPPGGNPPPAALARFFHPPVEYADRLSEHRSPLLFADGSPVKTAEDWARRRAEICASWEAVIGKWPAVIEHPRLEKLETKQRENFTQHRIRLEIGPGQTGEGYLLVPQGRGPFPAVFVPFYDPETSAGLAGKPLRDFAYQLVKRGFVALCIGSPGGDARKPVLGQGVDCQPLHYLGYVCANAWQALADQPKVDAKRIGVVGHSYGGKWSMFGSCFWEKYACAVWSDGGVVFDEARPSVNYWEPWYLGHEAGVNRKPGLITPESPRAGAYRVLREKGMDLHELHALMAPRPFLVSGGSEDFPARWLALNHAVAVNRLLGHENRVAMTNRPDHNPNEESNQQIYTFLEWALGAK